MSRIGKKLILIPASVEVKIEGKTVSVKGPKGEVFFKVSPEIEVEKKEDKLFVSIKMETKAIKALWGLNRVMIANMIKGVTDGFEKKLEIQGIGFKAALEGENLVLAVGFSHPVKMKIPQNIKVSVEKNIIIISGIDKELVGQFTANIRRIKPPEPYKGKGIRYVGEAVRRKVGKKVATATG
ncbi:MAG: 50S ribosomal protein L6 [Candidatus Nealsonbacteria bacterium]|nr:50S ribosomal protein L6 [Candidatus Nealsonbacteria bacterium]